MPYRAQRVVEQVLDLLGDRIGFMTQRLLAEYETALGERIRGAQDAELLDDWLGSRQALVRNGQAFAPAFMAALRQGCMDAYDHVGFSTDNAPVSDRIEPLRLLDESIVDEEGALTGMAARHESRCSLTLVLLGQRFAVLLERPPLPARVLPVGPHAFGRALRHAATEIGLRLHGRMALYDAYDRQHAQRYDSMLQDVDGLLDRAGILPGLSFVPLPVRDVPSHPERGSGRAQDPITMNTVGATSEVTAMRVVNQALDEVVPPGSLPEERLPERREAVSAMVRLVTRHGADSAEWRRCQAVIGEVIAAMREQRPVAPGTAEWIRDALQSVGYDATEGERLAVALAHMGADAAVGARADAALGAAARDWQRRLATLPEGATLGFTRNGGVTRARLRRRAATLDRVLLASEDDDKEAWVDVETVARLLAEGHAWLVRGPGDVQ